MQINIYTSSIENHKKSNHKKSNIKNYKYG